MRQILNISLIFCIYLTLPNSAHSAEIKRILTSDEPLLSKQMADGTSTGLFVDFFLSVAKEANRDVTVTHLPWKRAQLNAQEANDVTLGPITRTKKRESSYKWIGPLFPMRITYMTREDQSRIETLEDARKLKVAIKGGSASVFASKKHQLPEVNLNIVSRQDLILDMLLRDRVDAWLVWDVIAHRTVQEFDKGAKLQEGYTDELGELYMAASPTVSDQEIERWRKAMKIVIANGELNDITYKYLGRSYAQYK